MRQCAADKKIRDIDASAVGKMFADVINEITLITGLKMPVQIQDNGKEDGKPFAKLFSKFLLSQYGLLSCSEVTLAFRLNASGDLPEKTDFYGATLTIEHIGRVLSQYMRKRAGLSSKLREHREITENPPPTPEQIDMEDRLFVNEYYRKYLNSEFTTVSLEYAYMVYDSLDRRGKIQLTIAQKNKYMKEAQDIRNKQLALPAVDREERKEQNGLIDSYLNDALPVEEVERVKRYAKRLVLMDMFMAWKTEGKQKIFEDH